MGDETVVYDDASADDDPTGRRKLLKQMAAGAGGAALIWAAPTLTRTDRASAAASDDGGGGGGGGACSPTPIYSTDFAGVSDGGGPNFFIAHGPGPLVGALGWTVTGNVDAILVPGHSTGGLSPALKCIELAGSDTTNFPPNPPNPGDPGAITLTHHLEPGDYRFEFRWIDRSNDSTPDIGLPGRGFNVTLQAVAPAAVALGDAGTFSVSTAYNDVDRLIAKDYGRDFTVTSAGDITITMADVADALNGVCITDFQILDCTPP